MYRIMILKSKRDNYQSLYQYLTTTVDDTTVPLEIESKTELDAYVEDMLNNGGYAKSDFIVMNYIDYEIDAYNYSDDEDEDETEIETETETDEEDTGDTESGESTDDESTDEDEATEDEDSDEDDSDSDSDEETDAE